MRSDAEMSRTIDLYADTVRRICFIHLKNHADVEDVFQEVFLKYALREQPFESEAHKKAWLIRVAINASKDILKSFFRKNVSDIEELYEEPVHFDKEESSVLQAVLSLSEKYRDVLYLHYYEGYTAKEIAKTLDKNENTIYTRLDRAREKLKEIL